MFLRGCVPERLMRSVGIVPGLPRLECLLQRRQVEITARALPELPPHGAVEPFHRPVELGRAWWQHVESNLTLLAGLFEPGHELGAAIE